MRQAFIDTIDYEEILNCTRCGFCLPSCPTYTQTGDEVQSPRGRIALMKGVIDGVIEPDADVKRSIDLCLGCRACEPACPSGVNFGQLLEQTREAIYQTKHLSLAQRLTRKVTFEGIFPHHNRMVHLAGLTRMYQQSGLQSLARSIRFMHVLPKRLQRMESVLPEMPNRKQMVQRPTLVPARGPKKKRVAFFTGCLMDTMFLSTNDATIELLQLAGCEVVLPENQHCCGALHGHSGERQQGKELAKKNIVAFEHEQIDMIITNAGGCGAFLHDYEVMFQDDPDWADRARNFSEKITDISTVLVELHMDQMDLQSEEQIVTFQDSCHLRNGQHVSEAPRKLIQAVEGVTYVEMEDASHCCGSAGIYNIIEHDMSMHILDTKMIYTKKTKAKTIITANPGCFLQMKLGVKREGLEEGVRVVHLVDFLLESFQGK